MARIRTIKPEFFTSADICALPHIARILYIALWCEADREGRLVWNPRTFKIRYLPEDKCDIDQLCQTLIGADLVRTYESDGEMLAYIPTFLVHQQINNRESESRLPEPPADLLSKARVRHASGTRGDASGTPLAGREGKGRERKGTLSVLADDWEIPAEWLVTAKAKRSDVDWPTEAIRFKAHHQAKGSRMANWKAAWATWVNSPYVKSSVVNGTLPYQPMPGEY